MKQQETDPHDIAESMHPMPPLKTEGSPWLALAPVIRAYGVSQLARDIGVSRPFIVKCVSETSKKKPSKARLKQILDILSPAVEEWQAAIRAAERLASKPEVPSWKRAGVSLTQGAKTPVPKLRGPEPRVSKSTPSTTRSSKAKGSKTQGSKTRGAARGPSARRSSARGSR